MFASSFCMCLHFDIPNPIYDIDELQHFVFEIIMPEPYICDLRCIVLLVGDLEYLNKTY